MSSGHQQVTGNINSFNNIVNFITEIDAEAHQILQWLSPLEPQQRHQGVRTNRLNGVGNWVLETSEFRTWRDAGDGCVDPVLFCYGNPGVGKTYVSSLVIDSLCDQAAGKDVAVVGLYCDFHAKEEQSTTNMLGAMLKQFVSRGGMPEHIREAFRKAKKEFGGRGLLPPDMVDVLKKVIAPLPRVFICIDALDECTAKNRQELLESMQEIVRVSPNTRVFLTGRPHIDHEIVKCFIRAVRIPISPIRADIKSYLEMRLGGDTDPNAMDGELREGIITAILEGISESFLLVSLNMDAILSEITLTRRRRKLDEITRGEGLESAYTATLSRVRAQQRNRSELGMGVLMWVSHSERPLHVDELCHALGVEGSMDLDIRNIPAIETLLACSLGLVTVEKSSSTVRLVHYTLQEYLSHNHSMFHKPHSKIAEVCLTYLNFPHVKGFSPALRSVPPTAPFAEYASCHWGTHARQGSMGSVKTLALKLLGEYDKHISSKILLSRGLGILDQPFDREDTPKGFTGLHGAAYLGCVEITVALLEAKEWDLQETDFHGNTAIAWAARRGYEKVVRVLVERGGANPGKADKWGQTPLWWAARNRHEGVVRMLLERCDVNADKAGRWGQTPLSWGARNGHGGVVRMLLQRNDVRPNTVDTLFGQTPLSWAAERGHEGVVRMLLERYDVNPNAADTRYSRTALLWASRNGHQQVVRILLERNDVNPNKADKWGQTPLSRATRNGHQGVVRVLLERNDVNPDKADQWDQTPLSWAARNGHQEVVRMLLERCDVNADKAGRWGQTPLSWAARSGHEGAVRALLERNDVNPDNADQCSQTPLSWAAENGHERVVRVLLGRNDVDPDKADNWDQTPLSWAARNGHAGVVRALLELSDVSPSRADMWRRTPLFLATRNGHKRIASLLREPTDLIPNYAESLQSTEPLSPETSELSEPPSKRARKIDIHVSNPTLHSLSTRPTLPTGTNLATHTPMPTIDHLPRVTSCSFGFPK